MDIELVSQRDVDVAHEVSGIKFEYYSAEDIKRLSVRRIIRERAFDDFGRPVPRGLYDPALGVVSYADGACDTCGGTYDVCPGHFGHIELPFPIVNPLLVKTIVRLLYSSCWECGEIKLTKRARLQLLVKLCFEDASLPRCVQACDFYFSASGLGLKDDSDFQRKSLSAFFDTLPPEIKLHMERVDTDDEEEVDRAFKIAAKVEWERAAKAGRLLSTPSAGWTKMLHNFERLKDVKCPACSRKATKLRNGKVGRIFKINSDKSETMLSPTEIHDRIQKLWASARRICELFYGHKGRMKNEPLKALDYSHFFVKNVAVPPNRFRPSSKVGTMEVASEHPQNLCFSRILEGIATLVEEDEDGHDNPEAEEDAMEVDGGTPGKKKGRKKTPKRQFQKRTESRRERDIASAVSLIQDSIYYLYDNDPSDRTVKLAGIRQQLEAKAGLFRQHMMGKRVNFSCRSVIGPDVFLGTDEIGIPKSFAKLLTIPEPVTALNLKEMRQAVLNGPLEYPGATAVEYWTNSGLHKVTMLNKTNREAQAKMLIQNNTIQKRSSDMNGFGSSEKLMEQSSADAEMKAQGDSMLPRRVLRHLRNGDVVLFNRQPTLHRVSIMAHKVRVLPENRTIRFHYANCGSYNADFDGDEMNVHVPQDALARAEAEELMLSSRHYIVPTSGAPIRGIIQDHIAGASLLSRRDTFLRKEKFCQLLFSATDCITSTSSYNGGRYRLPIPAVLKPHQRWTGKQLLSSILDIIRGNRPGLYLETTSKTKANIVGREESQVLFRDGQLLRGTLDKSSLGASIYGAVHGVQEVYGTEASDNFLSCLGRLGTFYLREHGHTTGIDDLLLQEDAEQERHSLISNALDEISISCTNSVFEALGNDTSVETTSGLAKSVEDARMLTEEMVSRYGREAEDRLDTSMKEALNVVSSNVMNACLPGKLQKKFPLNGFSLMTSTGAKGSAVNSAQISCLVGSTVLEGKRVPRMGGSGATLPCFPPYDPSPNAGGYIAGRFLTGIAPFEFFFHAMAGREGLLDTSLKTANSGYLQRCLVKHLEGIRLHYDYTVRDSSGNVIQFLYGDDGIDTTKASWLMTKLDWQVKNMHCLRRSMAVRDPAVSRMLHSRKKDKKRGVDIYSGRYPSILEKLSPGVFSKKGAVSEKFRDEIEQYAVSNSAGEEVISFLESRYQECVAEPGEPVGIIAAQGVGEPSTQMTLNTFHHAGSSSAHVTLGIPRLRELIMTAAPYPKTPSMTIPMLPEVGMQGAKKLAQRLSLVRLDDLLLSIEVRNKHITLEEALGGMAVSVVGLMLKFPEPKMYEEELGISFNQVVDAVDDEFMTEFNDLLLKEVKRSEQLAGSNSTLRNVKRHIPKTLIRNNLSPDRGLVVDSDKDENSDDAKSKKRKAAKKMLMDSNAEDSDENMSEAQSVTDEEESDEGSSDEFSDEEEGEQIASQDVSPSPERTKGAANGSVDIEQLKREERELSAIAKKVINEIGPLGEPEPNEDGTAVEVTWIIPVSLNGRLQLSEIARDAARKVKLVHVERITNCFTEESETGPVVITEGSNLEQVFLLGHGLVDYNALLTNNMLGILKTYGVEALRLALIQEFKNVFKAYAIPVNIRHLNLIADYMTVNGTYRGFNRRSIDDAPSPFQKMTFETSVKFLSDAALYGTRDIVQNPSAAVAVGATYGGGTGGLDLLQKL